MDDGSTGSWLAMLDAAPLRAVSTASDPGAAAVLGRLLAPLLGPALADDIALRLVQRFGDLASTLAQSEVGLRHAAPLLTPSAAALLVLAGEAHDELLRLAPRCAVP